MDVSINSDVERNIHCRGGRKSISYWGGRRELEVEVQHQGQPTPARLQLRDAVASMLGVKQGQVYVVEVRTSYGGAGRSTAKVHVYDDEAKGAAVEPLYVRLRNMPPEEAKKIREAIKLRSRRRERRRVDPNDRREGQGPSLVHHRHEERGVFKFNRRYCPRCGSVMAFHKEPTPRWHCGKCNYTIFETQREGGRLGGDGVTALPSDSAWNRVHGPHHRAGRRG